MEVTSPSRDGRVRVVVATTVLLSFISFWRAAAIVLSDLGSTAFYVGGIVEQAIGKSAPWFVLGVMLFSYAVRALYIESSAMFVRAGVYRVVKEAMGGTLAKLSVSALLFDYVLTGPISGVSAGRYIAGLSNELLARGGCRHSSARRPDRDDHRAHHHDLLLVAQHEGAPRIERRCAADHEDHDGDGRHPDRLVPADAAAARRHAAAGADPAQPDTSRMMPWAG